MKLQQAIDYHASVRLDGWSPVSGWTSNITLGSFQAFDRFITERSFGQKKRIFLAGERDGPIPEAYPVVRTPGGRVYMVAAHNEDFINEANYNNIYLLQEAPYTVEIQREETVNAASGTAKRTEPRTVATVYGDLERISSMNSDEFSPVVFSAHIVTLPHGTELTTDHELLIKQIAYDVLEVWETMRTVVARVSKRSADA